MKKRKLTFSAVAFVTVILLESSFTITPRVPIRIEGITMGTTYHIIYYDIRGRNFKLSVDSLFTLINKSISTYDSSSEISLLGRCVTSLKFKLPYFYPPLKKSKQIYVESEGAYDPTVMPLVNAWGFGPRKIIRPDTNEIVSARKHIGFNKIHFNKDSVWKDDPGITLDFSAIGQGYGADVIADFLKSKAIRNFLVEVGGEGNAFGENLSEERSWQIGILDPATLNEFQSKSIASVILKNKSFTTSGNYYNIREIDGIKYSHTIDPSTGFPAKSDLISATVFADDCATADAWATAFIVMGFEKALNILKSHPELNVFFIYSTNQGSKTYFSQPMGNNIKLTYK